MSANIIEIVDAPIDLTRIQMAIEDPKCGAQLVFTGVVRNRNDGKQVRAVTYETYEPMAIHVLHEIALNCRTAEPAVGGIAIVHRIGTLNVGEISTVIAVSSVHRAACYEASRFLIEQLKIRVPIWKEEHYASGQKEWLDGSQLHSDIGCDTSRRTISANGDA